MDALHLSRPHAIMLVGIPGSGKSFFAKQFADTFKTPYLDVSVIQQYANNGGDTEQLVVFFLNEITKTKQTFLFEGNSATRTSRTEFAKWAHAKGYQPVFVWVQSDPVTSKGRILRTKSLSRDEFDAQLRHFSPPHADEKAVVISGRHTYATQLKVVLAHLSKNTRDKTARLRSERLPIIQKSGSRNITVQ